jgi:phenylalanyl-tRNA synthetase alpha chain
MSSAPTSLSPVLQALFAELEALLPELSQVTVLEQLESFRLDFLGRSGKLTLAKRELKDVAAEERPVVGQRLNDWSQRLEQALQQRKTLLEDQALEATLQSDRIDVTLPGVSFPQGKSHPLTRTIQRISGIFEGMGYQVIDPEECPEIETDYYNFEALNFPADHPARDMQDTFYTDLGPNVLLRSQTSNAQIRYMEKRVKRKQEPEFRVLVPGRVFRNEEVSSRKFVLFHQVEGLVVGKNIRFSDLKGTLEAFINALFEGERKTRFRPSYFPFTEPSAEVDVECIFCHGTGCKVCGQSGWLEILGSGMVHPNVLRGVGIDPEVYSGFAFGMGVERLAMLRERIQDIRLFYTNELGFLRQSPQ